MTVLVGFPAVAQPRHSRPILLLGHQRFLEAQPLAADEAPDGIVGDDHAPLGQFRRPNPHGQIRLLGPRGIPNPILLKSDGF